MPMPVWRPGLQYVGTLPVVSANTWHAVIERSHFRLDPYNPDGVWRRQKTKVTLVIFILAGCGSCTRNQPIFEQIQESVRHIEGASVYVMNCSQDEVTCRDQHITGYPSLVAYRSLAWLDGKHCLSDEASKTERYVRLDYHGVLLVPHVMGWFSEITSDTVINLKFGTISNDFELPVQLEATALPRHSRYLPRISGKRTDYFYPYMCFQLTCERLYGQAACVVKYSDEVPRSEYSNNFDMVITKVVLSRGDGIQTTVTQLGRTLYSTLEEESSGSIHRFHRPHRYNIHHQQRCEDDHRACTDLIVYFVRDHGRLPITGMTSQAFHTQQSFLFQDDLPVLVALVHQDNITEESAFYKTLKSIAYRFYNEFVIVSVDVDEFPSWSGQFVPHGGRHKFKGASYHVTALVSLRIDYECGKWSDKTSPIVGPLAR
ncbi:hypothetical protein LSH36_173g01002 [Paralvinella palmiformis]|uniref:Thioredoxin domain-containing protein n=1 Tax=Paralvinella palmiformis TaxID=53620 RepID=A0AAD9N679_9ANNE|nr:hypothetical protein LSH36_173g01002 [Paralvinella palmiformis]